MNPIADILKNIKVEESPPKSARSFREELINQFIAKILEGNKGTKYEPSTDAQIARFKRGIAIKINTNPALRQTWQLEGFLKMCLGAKSFGACFYGSLKINK